MNRLFRSKSEKSGELDKNSLRIIWFTIIISITSGVMSAIWLPNTITKFHWIRYLGALVVLAGILIRLISIFTLGKFFTVNLAIHESHRLIKKGFYKDVRHPS